MVGEGITYRLILSFVLLLLLLVGSSSAEV